MAYTFTKENVKLLALQAHFTVLCKKCVSLATKNAKVVSAQIKNNAQSVQIPYLKIYRLLYVNSLVNLVNLNTFNQELA